MKLIAFCGPKQSGKSTVAAAHLITNHGWQHRGFANALKIMLDAIGVPYECLYGDRKEEPLEMLSGRSARYAMQTLGEKWGRQGMHSDFWLNLWKHRVQDSRAKIVVDDLRYPNEHAVIKSLGGIVIRVKRAGYEHSDEHESEKHELPCDHVVVNEEGKPEVMKMWLDEFLATW